MIGSIVAQLCPQSFYPDALVQNYKAASANAKGTRATWDALRDAMICLSINQKLVILLDALDECEGREKVLSFLATLRKRENISIFVTSREKADI